MARIVPSVLLLALLVVPPAAGQVPAPNRLPESMSVPGGAAGLADALDVGENFPRSRLVLAGARLLWESPEGADPGADRRRAGILEYLQRVEVAADGPEANRDLVPAFFPADTWSLLLRDIGAPQRSLLAGILANRPAALLYHGVASLDQPTLDYLVAHPELTKEIAKDDRAAIFATFGRSLRVSAGRVLVPGGAEAVPLWEEIADAKVTDPGKFILSILRKNAGRLALVYDGIAHLDDGARRFALGLALPPDERVDRFKAFYDAAGDALSRWEPARRPFDREPFDAVHLLLSMTFDASGKLPGPPWPSFWKAVFRPGDLEGKVPKTGELEEDEPLDAARLLRLVAVNDAPEREERAATWLFAQRLFRDASALPLGDLLVTLRGHPRYPTLLLTLERIGITSPATYAAAVRAAGRLSRADESLWQFQAALAVVERAAASRAIDARAAESLVLALCKITPEDGGKYRGAVARWLDADFLGAVPAPLLPPDLAASDLAIETSLLAAMAGSVSSHANTTVLALPSVEWEGLEYRLDPAGSELRRLVRVRERQGGVPLDPVIALSRLAEEVAAAKTAAAAASAARQLPAVAERLRAASAGPGRPSLVVGELPEIDRIVAQVIDRVQRLKPTPDRKSLANLARPLQEAVDTCLAGVLGSIVYAAHLGEPDGPALLGGDPSRVHDFRFFKPGLEAGRQPAWHLPVEARDNEGWRISGSLLGLDLVIGRFSLRRVFAESLPAAPRFSDAERRAFTESALLLNVMDITDEGRDRLLAAVHLGRRKVAALGAGGGDVDKVAYEAELDEWRARALPWTVANDPEHALHVFSLGELARLGGLHEPTAPPGLDTWGTSGFSRDQGVRLLYPAHLCWTTVAGRRGVRAVASLVPDLTLGLAESSARLGLPAAVTAGLLAVATQDFIETLHTAHADDWVSLVAHAQAVARGRTEDYVAALTVTGPLVPKE